MLAYFIETKRPHWEYLEFLSRTAGVNPEPSIKYRARELEIVKSRNGDNQDELLQSFKDLLVQADLPDDVERRVLLAMGEIYLLELLDEGQARRFFDTLYEKYPYSDETVHAMLDIGEGYRLATLPEPEEEPVQVTLQNYPNPFNPETNIRFVIAEDMPVILGIYNIRGQLVRSLLEKKLPAGLHIVHWNGRDEWGGQVASGVYFLRLRAGAQATTRKMLLVK